MIKHVLMCKLKDATTTNDLVEILASLRDGIESLRSLEIGVDFKHSSLSFDLVVVATFDDRDALARFSGDPHHRAVAQKVGAICSAISIVDYETPNRTFDSCTERHRRRCNSAPGSTPGSSANRTR